MKSAVSHTTTPRNGKPRRSLGVHITLLVIMLALAISGATIAVGYNIFESSTKRSHFETGERLTTTAAAFVDADSVPRYLDTLETDEDYDRTLDTLCAIQKGFDIMALYVFTVKADTREVVYLYDTDPGENRAELGEIESMDGFSDEYNEQILLGGEVKPVIEYTSRYGWLISVTKPLYGSDGSVKGYVGVDFDMNRIMSELMDYLKILTIIVIGVTTVFTFVFLHLVRRRITLPVTAMAKAADNFLVGDLKKAEDGIKSAIGNISISTGDEMESLAESLKSMEHKINEYIISLSIVTLKSETDTLTKLLNREAFEQRVGAYLRSKDEKVVDAFLMIDVDFFKSVNDIYGHIAGDEVLSRCADGLREVLRSSDLAGRQGGDEFVVFCKGIGSAEIAAAKARAIRESWLKIIPQGGGEVSDKGVTASIGVALTARGDTFHDLYTNADEALYKAKENGRDGFVVYTNPEVMEFTI